MEKQNKKRSYSLRHEIASKIGIEDIPHENLIIHEWFLSNKQTREGITMIIKQQHKNGTLLQVVKELHELTPEEKARFIIPRPHKEEDIKTVMVHRNKENKIIKIAVTAYTEEYKANRNNVDLVDMFKNVEKAIKTKNVDADFARVAALKSVL